MKEQRVLVKCIYDTHTASEFQNQLQTLLIEGWKIIMTEGTKESILVLLERGVK